MSWWLLLAAAAQIPAIDVPATTHFSARHAEIRVGDGARAEPGKVFVVHYTLWLPDGSKADSSVDRGEPLSFEQGRRRVIAGWEAGFEGMRVGGKRRLFVPYQLAYGEKGRGPIPPKADLVFDVELLDVREPVPMRAVVAPDGVLYEGVSDARPTGSAAIAADGLAAGFSMTGRMAGASGSREVAGLFGSARRFASAADRVTLGPVAGIDGPLSAAVWFRFNQGGLRQTLLGCAGKFGIELTEANRLRFHDGAGRGFESWTEVPLHGWHALTAVRRAKPGEPLTRDNLTVFLDGREMDGRRDEKWTTAPGGPCHIGPPAGEGRLDADIDEGLLFRRALSDGEVAAFGAAK